MAADERNGYLTGVDILVDGGSVNGKEYISKALTSRRALLPAMILLNRMIASIGRSGYSGLWVCGIIRNG